MSGAVLLALDSGTSVCKAVAFDREGRVVATASRRNAYECLPGGGAEQDMVRTWEDAAAVLAELAARLKGREVLALAVTGQGDGTWLVDAAGEPVGPALLWLDGRAGAIVDALRGMPAARAAFAHTGTGLAACQQSAQLLWLAQRRPGMLQRAAVAMHCKDWLFLRLTGVAATDPSEACFTFGAWRDRAYRLEVAEALGLGGFARLQPPILDGTREARPLTAEAARRIGLPAGLPVVPGYVDVVCSALGGGLYGVGEAGVSLLGSTGMHLRLAAGPEAVRPCAEDMTGYCMAFPVPGHTLQAQSNMAATLNIDWLLGLAAEAASLGGGAPDRAALLAALDRAAAGARPGGTMFHPFISTAGERGPFTDPHARAAFLGLDTSIGLGGLMRGVYEGLGFAARDCYLAAGGVPAEVRVAGGAARSATMRAVLAACLDRPVRVVAQPEAGAAGAAMIAAVHLGLFADMADCARAWVAPLLGEAEPPDPALAARYAALFPLYRESCAGLRGWWRGLHQAREEADGHAA
jgi:erythritol kinase